jgi:hypothetical protein
MSIHYKDQKRTEFCDGAFRLLLFLNLKNIIFVISYHHVLVFARPYIRRVKCLRHNRYRYDCRSADYIEL